MNEGIRITAMTRTAAKPNKGGTRIVAFFDADTTSFTLRGCTLPSSPMGPGPRGRPGYLTTTERPVVPSTFAMRSRSRC
jgi:hypothetical protein